MKPSFRSPAALLCLVGCAKGWVPLDPAADPLAVERDRYACMQETSFLNRSATIDRNGARSGTDLTYDPEMFAACMRARGYVRGSPEERPERTAGPPRIPDAQPFTVGVEGSYGAAFGTESWTEADFAPVVDGTTGQVASTSSFFVHTRPGAKAALSFALAPHDLVELTLRAGLGSSTWGGNTHCFVSDDAQQVSCEDGGWGSATTTFGTLGVHARLPPLPRLGAQLDLGLQRLPGHPSTEVRGMYDWREVDGEELQHAEPEWTVPGTDALALPVARFGVDVDVIYAEPLGIRAGCGAELLLRSPELVASAERQDGSTLAPACTVAFRWSPGAVRPGLGGR